MQERLEYLGGGIKIIVSKSHTFGTDAILLADFAAPRKRDRACDLGTGCGIIPLLWCRNDYPEEIVAVDIQKDACEQLNSSIINNMLEKRISVKNADLRNLKGILPFGKFDLVTMNPPYKAVDTGLKSLDESAQIARHEIMCTVFDAADAAADLLKFGGRFCMCHRPERLCDVFEAMRKAEIEPKKLRIVAQRADLPPMLILIEGKKGGKAGLKIEPELVIENRNGKYSEEMRRIYGDYAEVNK